MSAQPAFALETDAGPGAVEMCRRDGERLLLDFADGSTAELTVRCQPGVAVFRLVKLDPRATVQRFRLFRLVVPGGAKIGGTLTAAHAGEWVAAVLPAEPNVLVEHQEGTLSAVTVAKHRLEPAAFGVLVCRRDELAATIERFEKAAGIPVPRLGGAWNKRSPDVKRSYRHHSGRRHRRDGRLRARHGRPIPVSCRGRRL